jgi:hypothetical protein
MTVRDSAPLHLSGTAFQAVVGDASGPAPGEMWENQLAGGGIFCGQIQKVVQLSKLGFPKSDPSLEVISLDHGLEAPCHEKARNRTGAFRLSSPSFQSHWPTSHFLTHGNGGSASPVAPFG